MTVAHSTCLRPVLEKPTTTANKTSECRAYIMYPTFDLIQALPAPDFYYFSVLLMAAVRSRVQSQLVWESDLINLVLPMSDVEQRDPRVVGEELEHVQHPAPVRARQA